MFKVRNISAFTFSALCAVITTVIICVCAVSCSGGQMSYKSQYYFVCYRITDNTVSASSLSSTVSSYGGAGYILHHKKNYYVTVSCYYQKRDAETVCASLKKRDLECSVLEIETNKYKLKNSAKKDLQLFLGNLNTLNSLSLLAYEGANKLDTGEFSQNKAKEIIYSVQNGIKGLLKSNESNCFTNGLNKIYAECEDKQRGFLMSKDLRYLQIAIVDLIINVKTF